MKCFSITVLLSVLMCADFIKKVDLAPTNFPFPVKSKDYGQDVVDKYMNANAAKIDEFNKRYRPKSNDATRHSGTMVVLTAVCIVLLF